MTSPTDAPPAGPSETPHRALAGLALLIGAGAVLSPRALLRLYGVAPAAVTGPAAFGWRLFGVRTAAIALAALRGSPAARAAVLPIQLADQAVFAHAAATRALPGRTAPLAMASSAVLIALDLAGRRAAR